MTNYIKLISPLIEKINISLGNKEKSNNPINDYKKYKSKISKNEVVKILKINEQILNGFELALYNFEKFKEDKSLNKISFLRLANWLNTLDNFSDLNLSVEFESIALKEDLTYKQVRAIELLIRDIIYDFNNGPGGVTQKLDELFKSEVIQKWIKNSDDSGVLSGTTFNELSSLFLDKRFFSSYDDLFVHEDALKYDNKKISSLRYFLDDIRIIRNTIAHNKKVNSIQIELLNEYYEDISKKIQKAFSEGKTTVNPGIYLDVSQEELKEYISSVKEDINEIKQGVEKLNEKIDVGFSSVLKDTEKIKSDSEKTRFSTKYILFGVLAILSLVIVIIYFLGDQSLKTDNISDKIDNSSKEINNNIKDVKDIVSGDSELKNMSNSGDLTIAKELNERTKHVDAKKIAIVYFENTGEERKLDKLKKGLAGMLISDLSNIYMLDIVERDRLEEILKEQKLQKSKGFDSNTAVQVGKLLGAEIILTGAYFEMFGSFRIDARFIDVETGEILKSEGVDGISENFFKLEKQLVWKIIKNLDLKLSPEESKALETAENKQKISFLYSLLFSQALEHIDSGQIDEAIQVLNKIIKKYPDFVPANRELKKLEKIS